MTVGTYLGPSKAYGIVIECGETMYRQLSYVAAVRTAPTELVERSVCVF